MVDAPTAPLWFQQWLTQTRQEERILMPVRFPAFTTDDMPPAADWPDHAVKNTTQDTLCVSNGTNWIRQDTGAAL